MKIHFCDTLSLVVSTSDLPSQSTLHVNPVLGHSTCECDLYAC
jgi:hypothetical protein